MSIVSLIASVAQVRWRYGMSISLKIKECLHCPMLQRKQATNTKFVVKLTLSFIRTFEIDVHYNIMVHESQMKRIKSS